MGATVFEIAGGSARPPPLVKGVGTKRLGKGRVKPKTPYQNFLVKWNQLKKSSHQKIKAVLGMLRRSIVQ